MSYSPELGYIKDTFEDLKKRIEDSFVNAFGTIDLDPDAPLGQITAIFSERLASISEDIEGVQNSGNPDTATGFSLDGVADFLGVRRLAATPTVVTTELVGVNQTLITWGSQATALGVNTTFSLTSDVLLTNESCLAININITDIDVLNFTLTINSVSFTHAKNIADTELVIINALVSLINDSALEVTASNVNNTLFVKTNVAKDLMQVYVTEGLGIVSVTANGRFEALDKGKISLPAKALTNIATPIGGWSSIINELSGTTGRNLETDAELRVRRTLSTKLGGAGTVSAILARLLNIAGVTAVTIIENKNNQQDLDNRPAHSFESIVLGGEDTDIANVLWLAKPCGIQAYGNTTVVITDSTGNEQVVGFSRPIKLYTYVKVTLTKNSFYPLNGDDLIKEGIAKQINSLNVGQAVVYQSLYQSVYSVTGITTASIEIGGNIVEALPALASANLTVLASQIAVSDISKINIETV